MKRILCVLLITVLLLCAMSVTVLAAERGDTATVSFSVSNHPGLSDFSISIVYDHNALELTDLSAGSLTGSGVPMPNVSGDMFAWMNTENVSGSGTLCVATFKVKDTAAKGTYSVSASVNSSYNAAGDTVQLSVSGGSITVAIPTCTTHTFGSYTGSEPTCTTDGVKTATCSVCGVTDTKTTSRTGHSFGAWSKADNNNHVHTCSVCKTDETAAHTWDAGTVVKAATCKEAGISTYTCTTAGCGATKTEETAKSTNHTYGNWSKVNDSTHKHTCSVCQKEETASHTWDNGTVTKQATCSTTGTRTYTCTATGCGATKTEEIAKTNNHTYGSWSKADSTNHKRTCTVSGCTASETEAHAWNSGEVIIEPSCTEPGEMKHLCTKCNANKTEDIQPNGKHIYSKKSLLDEKVHEVACRCGEAITEDHTWDAGVITEEPTCSKEGVKTFTCADCKGNKTEAVPTNDDHDYTDSYKDNGNGTHTSYCVCKDGKEEPHDFSVEGSVVKEATTKETGEQEMLCICGAKTTKALPMLEKSAADAVRSAGIIMISLIGAIAVAGGGVATFVILKNKRK